LEDVALVTGTQQNLSNLYSLDIYGSNQHTHTVAMVEHVYSAFPLSRFQW